jgi:hypothetical protein
MVLAHSPRPHWLGRENAPRVLAGIETRLKLEKHRRLRPGQSTTVFFQCEETVGCQLPAVGIKVIPTAGSRQQTARKAS